MIPELNCMLKRTQAAFPAWKMTVSPFPSLVIPVILLYYLPFRPRLVSLVYRLISLVRGSRGRVWSMTRGLWSLTGALSKVRDVKRRALKILGDFHVFPRRRGRRLWIDAE